MPAVVVGGTPTFPIHAQTGGRGAEPGHTAALGLTDTARPYPDLDFLARGGARRPGGEQAAPGKRVCLDLGTKALASEMPQPRLSLLDVGDYRIVAHNEEHLVIETPDADRYRTGDVVYGVPVHICPTVARYEAASVMSGGRCTGEWQVAARNRRITI